jgi:1-deoxy-D-xylulose-5-phosphate synthase
MEKRKNRMAILDKINHANDIKKLTPEELLLLPDEIREFLVRHVSETGGHLASNLGAVELTMALHLILDFPEDKLIWDVGHQSYTHKILTGRKEGFDTLRQYGGMSGFPKRSESICDSFDTGHSSTAISAGIGMAEAREILGKNYKVVSVIGDGAFTGGLAFEGLNNATALHSNFIIVLNDNQMSISPNVGGFSNHLASLRTADSYKEFKSGVHSKLEKLPYGERVARRMHKAKNSLKQLLIPGMLFENMGITYLGPIDGHNLADLVHILTEAKRIQGPVLVHVMTKKGKGYFPAEQHPDQFHGVGPFDAESGKLKKKKNGPDYTEVFSTVITNMAKKNDRIVAITAAMADGTGLNRFRQNFPKRFFDVGIAEGHGVTFAAGLAAAGMRPVFAVYSSFLQRGFDELIEDVCLQKLPVLFAIDRAGLVGADGDTHQGIFDLSYLNLVPNLMVMAPKNARELADMLRFAMRQDGPAAIRYSRGAACMEFEEMRAEIEPGKSELMEEGEDLVIYALGSMVQEAWKAVQILKQKGIHAALVNARFLKPLDRESILRAGKKYPLIVTMEENVLTGGFGQSVEAVLEQAGIHTDVLTIGIEDCFVPHGSVDVLRQMLRIDSESAAERIERKLRDL